MGQGSKKAEGLVVMDPLTVARFNEHHPRAREHTSDERKIRQSDGVYFLKLVSGINTTINHCIKSSF